jgi:hypothetical protein
VARVLALCPELMLASRVEASLRAAGHEVTVSSDAAAAGEFDLVVADLDSVDVAAVADESKLVLGFYSHVDVETRRQAEEAGFDLVVPRSRMARELPALVDSLLGET